MEWTCGNAELILVEDGVVVHMAKEYIDFNLLK